jgi:hypothetical protein
MKCHPVCDLFPPMSADEFAGLKADIQKHGVRDPVWIYDGLIIDGKNRATACEQLGIVPPTREWKPANGQSLVEFAFSVNAHRRHLTQGQRAAVAVAMLPMLEAEAKERQSTSTGGVAPTKVQLKTETGKAAEHAAKLAGTSTRYVEQAKRLPPDQLERVRTGKVSMPAAVKEEAEKRHAKDGLGNLVVDSKLLSAFTDTADTFDDLMRRISQIKSDIKSLAGTPAGAFLTFTQMEADLNCLRSALKFAKPYAACCYCKARGCKVCRNLGWLGEDLYEQAPRELKP